MAPHSPLSTGSVATGTLECLHTQHHSLMHRRENSHLHVKTCQNSKPTHILTKHQHLQLQKEAYFLPAHSRPVTAVSRKLRPARRTEVRRRSSHGPQQGTGAPAPSRPEGSQDSEGLRRVPPGRQGWKRKAPLSRRGGSAPTKWRPGGSGLTWPGSAPRNGGRGSRGSPHLRAPPLPVSALPEQHCACAHGGGGASPAPTRREPGSAAHARWGVGPALRRVSGGARCPPLGRCESQRLQRAETASCLRGLFSFLTSRFFPKSRETASFASSLAPPAARSGGQVNISKPKDH